MNRCPDVTAGYEKGYIIGMVVWVEEIVFIKPKGTRMTRIRRILTDLRFPIQSYPCASV
ncbi:MAG: hypothetical protein L6282_14175 [Candidatus Methanoperedenaceae archaeon]|nr:hypothetical protein [Candidatus Methanoperedenaceae archaeon]